MRSIADLLFYAVSGVMRYGYGYVQGIDAAAKEMEIVCIAGIDGNGQSELVYGLSGLSELKSGTIHMDGKDLTRASVCHFPVSACGLFEAFACTEGGRHSLR